MPVSRTLIERPRSILLRITELEYQRVERLALAHGLNIPAVIRHLISGSAESVICQRGFGCRHAAMFSAEARDAN